MTRGRDTYKIISKVNLKCYIINDTSKMRKVKMATILLLYKINYLIFTPR